MTFLVTYDLNRPGQNYPGLYDRIKSVGSTYWHCADSTWIVVSRKTAAEIRDYVSAVIDTNDKLLVARLSAPGAWKGFDQKCSDWLQTNL